MKYVMMILMLGLLMTTPCYASNVPQVETAQVEQTISLTQGIFLSSNFSKDYRWYEMHVYDCFEGKIKVYKMLTPWDLSKPLVLSEIPNVITQFRRQFLGTIVELTFKPGTEQIIGVSIIERFQIYADTLDEYGNPIK
jgi:hypothetical protein